MGQATVGASNNLEIYRIWQLDEKYLEFRKQKLFPIFEHLNENKTQSSRFNFELIDGINVFKTLSFAPYVVDNKF